jgi:hypothetical protein
LNARVSDILSVDRRVVSVKMIRCLLEKRRTVVVGKNGRSYYRLAEESDGKRLVSAEDPWSESCSPHHVVNSNGGRVRAWLPAR